MTSMTSTSQIEHMRSQVHWYTLTSCWSVAVCSLPGITRRVAQAYLQDLRTRCCRSLHSPRVLLQWDNHQACHPAMLSTFVSQGRLLHPSLAQVGGVFAWCRCLNHMVLSWFTMASADPQVVRRYVVLRLSLLSFAQLESSLSLTWPVHACWLPALQSTRVVLLTASSRVPSFADSPLIFIFGVPPSCQSGPLICNWTPWSRRPRRKPGPTNRRRAPRRGSRMRRWVSLGPWALRARGRKHHRSGLRLRLWQQPQPILVLGTGWPLDLRHHVRQGLSTVLDPPLSCLPCRHRRLECCLLWCPRCRGPRRTRFTSHFPCLQAALPPTGNTKLRCRSSVKCSHRSVRLDPRQHLLLRLEPG